MTSFLDLPYNVRRRVYIMAGLVRVCPVNMNTESLDNTAFVQSCFEWMDTFDWDYDGPQFQAVSLSRCRYQSLLGGNSSLYVSDEGFDCMCLRLPLALLRVCRTIYNEVFKMLYTENRFRICQTQHRGLAPLLQLSPRAVAHLRTLSIRLNRCCCTRYGSCKLQKRGVANVEILCSSCHSGCRGGDNSPLQLKFEDTTSEYSAQQDVLSSWKRAAQHLSKHIQPGKLRLSIVCDCADDETARRIVQPMKALPNLAACDMRLGQHPNTTQADIARETALERVGISSKPSFPFSKLPTELQMRVLSHTQLVHPEGVLPGWFLTIPVPGECCLACTGTLDACCCQAQHGAFSTSDARCFCWAMPVSLFLVNHKFYELGTEIFFSNNIFEIDWNNGSSDPDDVWSQSLSMLLARYPESTHRHIRKIHIRLHLLWYTDLGPHSTAKHDGYSFALDWAENIALMSTRLNLPRLTLWIEDTSGRERSARNLETGFDDSLEVEEHEWTLYQHLIQPIVDLGTPLHRFALQFCYPPYGRYHELRDQRRRELERSIMGEMYCSDNVSGLRDVFGMSEKPQPPRMFEPLQSMPEED